MSCPCGDLKFTVTIIHTHTTKVVASETYAAYKRDVADFAQALKSDVSEQTTTILTAVQQHGTVDQQVCTDAPSHPTTQPAFDPTTSTATSTSSWTSTLWSVTEST